MAGMIYHVNDGGIAQLGACARWAGDKRQRHGAQRDSPTCRQLAQHRHSSRVGFFSTITLAARIGHGLEPMASMERRG
jgi:hypothetical protein